VSTLELINGVRHAFDTGSNGSSKLLTPASPKELELTLAEIDVGDLHQFRIVFVESNF